MNNELSVDRYQNLLKRKASLEAQVNTVMADKKILTQNISAIMQKYQVNSVEECRVKKESLEAMAIDALNKADQVLDKAQAEVNNYMNAKAQAKLL